MMRAINFKNIGVFSLSFGVLIMSLSCRDATPPPVQGTPRVELWLSHVDLSEQEVVFEISITNAGPGSLTIPHLQEGKIEEYGLWYGFDLIVRGSNDELFNIPVLRTPTLSRNDLITLAPGGSLSVKVNMAKARWRYRSYGNRQYRVLAQEPGSYTAIAYMNISRENLPIGLKNRVWVGYQPAKPVHFSIPSE